MTFIDRIADAREIDDVFDLVDELLSALHYTDDVQQITPVLRPGRINTADDLAYWLKLLSAEIHDRDARQEAISEAMFALHAVLETAQQRLRGIAYH